MSDSTLISFAGKLTREQLALVATPPGTATHRPIPHSEVVAALVETLGFRHIGVVKDEFAVSRDGEQFVEGAAALVEELDGAAHRLVERQVGSAQRGPVFGQALFRDDVPIRHAILRSTLSLGLTGPHARFVRAEYSRGPPRGSTTTRVCTGSGWRLRTKSPPSETSRR